MENNERSNNQSNPENNVAATSSKKGIRNTKNSRDAGKGKGATEGKRRRKSFRQLWREASALRRLEIVLLIITALGTFGYFVAFVFFSSHMGQRANIIVAGDLEHIRHVRYAPDGSKHTWHYTITYGNTSDTEATDAISIFHCAIMPQAPSELEFVGSMPTEKLTVHTIPGKSPQRIGESVLDESDIYGRDLGDNFDATGPVTLTRAPLYCWSWLAYRDDISSKPRVTPMCAQLVATTVGYTDKLPIQKFVMCETHNCSSEQSKCYKDVVSIMEANSKLP